MISEFKKIWEEEQATILLFAFIYFPLVSITILNLFFYISINGVIRWSHAATWLAFIAFIHLVYFIIKLAVKILVKGEIKRQVVLMFNCLLFCLVFAFILTPPSETLMTFKQELLIPRTVQNEKQLFYVNNSEKVMDELDKGKVLVFFKRTCPKCKKSVPALIEKAGKNRDLIFVDMGTTSGASLAKDLGVSSASTAVYKRLGVTQRVDLAVVQADGIKVNDLAIEKVLNALNEIKSDN